MVLWLLDMVQTMVMIFGLWGIRGVLIGERKGTSDWKEIWVTADQESVELRSSHLIPLRLVKTHPILDHHPLHPWSHQMFVTITTAVQILPLAAAFSSLEKPVLSGVAVLLKVLPAVMTTTVAAPMTIPSATLMLELVSGYD